MPNRRGSTYTMRWPSSSSKPHPRVRRLDRGIEQQRPGHPQVDGAGSDHPTATRPGTCPSGRRARSRRRAARLDRRRPSGRVQRGSRISSSHDRPALEVRRQLAADRLDFGELGHRRSYYTNDSPGSSGAPRHRPATQRARADVGQRAVVPARAVALERRQQRRVLARVIGVRRRSGRSRDRRSAPAGRRARAAPATRATRASISRSARWKPGDVVAVAVDLVGLDRGS